MQLFAQSEKINQLKRYDSFPTFYFFQLRWFNIHWWPMSTCAGNTVSGRSMRKDGAYNFQSSLLEVIKYQLVPHLVLNSNKSGGFSNLEILTEVFFLSYSA
jgi:hypothetical protein